MMFDDINQGDGEGDSMKSDIATNLDLDKVSLTMILVI
jgi:hypothetical protein